MAPFCVSLHACLAAIAVAQTTTTSLQAPGNADTAELFERLSVRLETRDVIPGDATCQTSCASAISTALSLAPTYCTQQSFVDVLNTCLSCTLLPQNAQIWTAYGINELGQPCGLIAAPGQVIGQSWTTVSQMPEMQVPTGLPAQKAAVLSGSVVGSGDATSTSVAGTTETLGASAGGFVVGAAVALILL